MFRASAPSHIQMQDSRSTMAEFFAKQGGRVVLTISVTCTLAAIGLGAWPWDILRDSTTIETIRNIVIAAAVPPSIIMALWRASVAQQNAESARREADTASHDLLAHRYRHGVELLSDDKRHIRIGAVHLLRDLAYEHPDLFLRPVSRLLCGYVRHPPAHSVPDDWNVEEHIRKAKLHGAFPGDRPEVVDDVMDAVLALCELAEDNQCRWGRMGLELDLRGAFLQNTIFDKIYFEGLLLESAILNHTQFYDLDLTGANLMFAELVGTTFGQTNLTEAKLDRANLYLARFIGSNLTEAQLFGANLEGAVFDGSTLTSAMFSFDTTKHPYVAWPKEIVRDRDGRRFVVARGLTQAQLEGTFADPCRPPKLEGVLDEETGLELTWNRHEHNMPA